MKINVRSGAILQEHIPNIVVGVCEGEPLPDEIAPLLEVDDFQGKSNELIVLYPRSALPSQRLLLVGMGERNHLTNDGVRQAAAVALRKLRDLKQTDAAISLPFPESVPVADAAQALAEGAHLAQYYYLEHKSKVLPEETLQMQYLLLFVPEAVVDDAQRGVDTGYAVAQGVKLARDLANAPGNVVTPTRLAEVAQEVGERAGLKVTVWGLDELQQKGFGGLLAVAQGSDQPPRFIMMEYGGTEAEQPVICLVGKGITFDTGGISIKPAQSMDDMKMDMSGAAAVIGTMHVVAELKLPLRVIGLISAAENMPGARAYKPGDVITTLSGKTVEVLNTDAEGRIVLADALFYAQQYKPQAIVDMATLTGAINVALGPHAIGLLGNNQSLADRMLRAGETAFERVWQLPLWDEYHEMLKSEVADLKNIGGRNAGSITAAAFLSAFVGDYHWVHLDIASTAWTTKPSRPYQAKGATGVGVRVCTQMLRDWDVSV